METCESCIHSATPDNKYPCSECHGATKHYLRDSGEPGTFEACWLGGGDIYAPDDTDAPDDKSEKDPAGLALNTPGAKADKNKPRVDLIFDGMPLALLEVARVATFGAAKYSDHGWMKVPNGFQRYTAAMDRHRLQEGEFIDRDSGLAHAAHAAWNALARLELLMREGAAK